MCAHPFFFFFFNDTATTEIYTLSLHDALPISGGSPVVPAPRRPGSRVRWPPSTRDRKSARLNSSHVEISYAVLCLKKKNHDLNGGAGARTDLAVAPGSEQRLRA